MSCWHFVVLKFVQQEIVSFEQQFSFADPLNLKHQIMLYQLKPVNFQLKQY